MWASAAAGTLKEHSLCLLNPRFMVSLLTHNHILQTIRLFLFIPGYLLMEGLTMCRELRVTDGVLVSLYAIKHFRILHRNLNGRPEKDANRLLCESFIIVIGSTSLPLSLN